MKEPSSKIPVSNQTITIGETTQDTKASGLRGPTPSELLGIANGKLVLAKEQHKALIFCGRLKGWSPRPPGQR